MKRKFIKKTGFALLLFLTVLIYGSIFVMQMKQSYIMIILIKL